MCIRDSNWVVQNLENALNTWNEKLAVRWQLVTQSPENFRGGTIWNVIVDIHGAVQAIGCLLYTSFCHTHEQHFLGKPFLDKNGLLRAVIIGRQFKLTDGYTGYRAVSYTHLIVWHISVSKAHRLPPPH